MTKALKDQFPNAKIFGPAHYGFLGFYNWLGELTATPNGSDWFTDKYLPAIKTASTTSAQLTAISGAGLSGTAKLYQMTAASAQTQVNAGGAVAPVPAGTVQLNGTSLTISLPALSVTTIDVQ